MKKLHLIFMIIFASFMTLAEEDDEKLKLAVMEFEDLSGKIEKPVLDNASEYVRIMFARTNRYFIISKHRHKSELSDIRKKFNNDPSYKSCTDKNCQIQLGQALSADMMVKTTISFFAGLYTIASELIDLEKEATIIAAAEEYDGSDKELKQAIDKIVEKIVTAEKSQNIPTDTPVANEPEIQPQQVTQEEFMPPQKETTEPPQKSSAKNDTLEWSHNFIKKATWQEAGAYCRNLNEGGHNDWRLPNIDELRSLIKKCPQTEPGGKCNISERNGFLSKHFFSRDCSGCRNAVIILKGSGWFWSSSEMTGTNHYWVISFKNARVSHGQSMAKYNAYCVR